MTPPRALWRLLLSLPLLGLLAPACLRLSEPDSFICSVAADCLADERCSSQGICAPKDSCEQNRDCDASQVCQNGECLAAECYQGRETACGTFRCEYFTGRCHRACATEHDCQDGNRCNGGQCVTSRELANDETCSQNTECASRVCCGPLGRKVCKQACGAGGSPCQAASECASGNCCATPPFAHICSSSACMPLDVGDVCTLPTDCASGSCTNGVCAALKCQADSQCPGGFCASGSCEAEGRADGATCDTNRWCASGSCISKVCQGKVKPGDACRIDDDCDAASVCCVSSGVTPGICSPHNLGCRGGIGESCDYSGDDTCLIGSCVGSSFCSIACAVDSDCRVSPWGTKNLCRKNRFGDSICFPGCASDIQCTENVGEYFSCTSNVCSGDYLSDDDVRLQ
jgi:hypothetical protein